MAQQITKTTMIAGWPAIQLRDMLLGIAGNTIGFTVDQVQGELDCSQDKAKKLVNDLQEQGYIRERSTTDDHESNLEQQWQCTEQGFQLANARTSKPVPRAKAQAELDAFLQRVYEVNHSQDYAYWIEKLILFGSMLTDKEEVGDVDVAFTLRHRGDTQDQKQEIDHIIIKRAKESGKRFKDFYQELYYPHEMITKAIKAKSRILSLHEGSPVEEMNLQPGEFRFIYNRTQQE